MLRIGPRRSKGSQEVGLERLIFCVLYFTCIPFVESDTVDG